MIWDVDSYIVYEPGDLQIGAKVMFRFEHDPEYRRAARERYAAAQAKQTAKNLRYAQKRRGTES